MSMVKCARNLTPGDAIVYKGASRTVESVFHRGGLSTIDHEIGRIFCPSSKQFLLSMTADDVLDQIDDLLERKE